MGTLSVWRFDSAQGADEAIVTLERLAEERLVTVHDAATGALTGSLTDVGINGDFIERARDEITPGTSGLFVLTSNAVLDKIEDAFAE